MVNFMVLDWYRRANFEETSLRMDVSCNLFEDEGQAGSRDEPARYGDPTFTSRRQ